MTRGQFFAHTDDLSSLAHRSLESDEAHDLELALLAQDRAWEHTGTEEEPMIDLEKAPVGLTVTVQDCEILIGALKEYEGGDLMRRLLLLGHVSNCMDASMDKHRDAGVKPAAAVREIKRVSEMGTVLPLRPDAA